MKTKEDIIVRSKRDLYEYFDARIKSIEDKINEMCAIEDKAKSEEEETVTLRIQYETEREETITIPLSSLCLNLPGIYLYMERTTGPLAGKAFLLNEEYDWELGVDDEGALCLVPIRKEVKNKKKNIIGHFEPR